MMAPTAEQLRVVILPDFSASNPYQRELSSAMRRRGVDVRAARPPGRDPLGILTAWLRHGRPGVVHLHWTHNYLGGSRGAPGVLTRLRFLGQIRLLKALGVRLVWTVHNLGGHEGAGDREERVVHRRLVLLSDAVICHCDAAVDAVMDTYALPPETRHKLHVIPHGTYVGAYPDKMTREDARARLGLPPDAHVLCFFGTIRHYKGIDELIAAFRATGDPSLRLLVCGVARAPAAAALGAAARADARIVLRLGYVPDDEVQVVLRAADAVVLPFRDILTSGSAILAMSFGRAVITPRLGCLPETVGDAGILYDASQRGALEAALQASLEADLDAMGVRGLERARRLDWNRIAAATMALYSERRPA